MSYMKHRGYILAKSRLNMKLTLLIDLSECNVCNASRKLMMIHISWIKSENPDIIVETLCSSLKVNMWCRLLYSHFIRSSFFSKKTINRCCIYPHIDIKLTCWVIFQLYIMLLKFSTEDDALSEEFLNCWMGRSRQLCRVLREICN